MRYLRWILFLMLSFTAFANNPLESKIQYKDFGSGKSFFLIFDVTNPMGRQINFQDGNGYQFYVAGFDSIGTLWFYRDGEPLRIHCSADPLQIEVWSGNSIVGIYNMTYDGKTPAKPVTMIDSGRTSGGSYFPPSGGGGYTPSTSHRDHCWTCGGLGRCATCGGLGHPVSYTGGPHEPCVSCGGSGRCPHCHGSGLQ